MSDSTNASKWIVIGIAFIIVAVMVLQALKSDQAPFSENEGGTEMNDPVIEPNTNDQGEVVQLRQIRIQCTNTSADAATINAAIASSKEGDEIIFEGTCLINETIKLLGNRSYRGESRTGTVLKQADGANLEALIASDSYLDNTAYTGNPVSVRQLTIDGNASNNTAAAHGILLRSWQSVVTDVNVRNCGGSGIKLSNQSANGTKLNNTQVNGQINGNFIENSGEHGIYIQDEGNSLTDWQLMDNWIADSGKDGIHLDNAAGWIVERNHIYGVQHDAIYANRMFGTAISDNYIEDFGGSADAGTYYGIAATIQGDVGSVIANNRVFAMNNENNPESVYRFIGISHVNYGNGLCSVTGNVVRGSKEPRGVGLYYNGGSHDLTIVSLGNAVLDVEKAVEIGSNVITQAGY